MIVFLVGVVMDCRAILFLFLAASLAACSSVELNEDSLSFQGEKLRRFGASNETLGAIGRAKRPIFARNIVFQGASFDAGLSVPVKPRSTMLSFTEEEALKLEGGAELELAQLPIGASLKGSGEDETNYRVVMTLTELYPSTYVERIANLYDDTTTSEFSKRVLRGKNTRFVSKIVIASKWGERAIRKISGGASVSGEIPSKATILIDGEAKLTAEGNTSRTREITFGEGTVVGYEMSMICWETGEIVTYAVHGWGVPSNIARASSDCRAFK